MAQVILSWLKSYCDNFFKQLLNYPGFVHVRKSQIQGLFKDIQGHVYQQIQGLNTEEKGLEISKI